MQNELRFKDKTIKTLMETQTAILENLPLSKPQQQTENNTSFHNSPEKNVDQLNQNIVFKRQPNQEYNNQSQHYIINNQYQKVSKQQNRNHYQKSKQEKRLCNGNLNKDLKKQDLIELFGFNATTYLQKKCRVELPSGKSGKNKGSGFAVMPEHLQKEVLKLHGIEFHGNKIIIEEATSTRIKRPDEQNTQRRTTEVVNDSSKNVDLIRANTVPGSKSYADAAMSRNTKNSITKKVIVFGDSIIPGIRVRDFNQQVKNVYAKFKSFPGCNSKEMLHYIESTLETGFYDSVLLHVGVNDLLNDKTSSITDNLISNLVNIVNKCKSLGVMDLFVSGIAFNKRLPYTVIKKVNEKIADMCNKNGLFFIDNGNTSNMDLYQDGSHLLERGKCLLANSFIFVLNNFLNMHSHHPLIDISNR